jgi:hypothetical protein
MDPTLTGIVTCLNSTYLVVHGTIKILNRCGFTVCFEKVVDDEIELG